MRDLLFLAHRIPYPPDKGDKIRSWNILTFLAKRYRVHLGCFVDDPRDIRHQPFLEGLCDECYFAPLGRLTKKFRSLHGFLAGEALTVALYRDAGLAAWVDDIVRRRQLERIFVSSSGVAPYAMGVRNDAAVRVIDFIDVDSDKWHQYAATKPLWARWIYRREGRLLLKFERSAASSFNTSIFVSAREADLFRSLAPESAQNIRHLDNGVDFNYFSPNMQFESPYADTARAIVFTGAMDYWPNVEAVTWFSKDVFPTIHREFPSAQFFIVGANPTAEVRSLDRLRGVNVVGRVPDVRPYLAFADVAVAPLRIARGIQNKVLEAMAMAKPVVATPEAVEGIRADVAGKIVLETDAKSFATATIALLNGDRAEEVGRRARDRVVTDYDWANSLNRILEFLERPDAADGRPATIAPGFQNVMTQLEDL